jgi:hypothetical protein
MANFNFIGSHFKQKEHENRKLCGAEYIAVPWRQLLQHACVAGRFIYSLHHNPISLKKILRHWEQNCAGQEIRERKEYERGN